MAWDGNWTEMAIVLREETAWTASSGCSATATATAMWTGWTAPSSGPRSGSTPARRATCGTSTSMATATLTATTTGSLTAASAGADPGTGLGRDGDRASGRWGLRAGKPHRPVHLRPTGGAVIVGPYVRGD